MTGNAEINPLDISFSCRREAACVRLKFCVLSSWCSLFDPLERISVCDSYLLGVYKLYV